jgi:hypothetical protein
MSMLPLLLLFGGIPFALGLGLVFGGRSVIRRARSERKAADGDVPKTFE